jgi:hypothetical protein
VEGNEGNESEDIGQSGLAYFGFFLFFFFLTFWLHTYVLSIIAFGKSLLEFFVLEFEYH